MAVCWSIYAHIPEEIQYGCYSGGDLDLEGPFPVPNDLDHLTQPFRDPVGLVCWNNGIKWVFLGLLLALQCVLLVWFSMILKVAYKVVSGQGADDTRSDDEDDDEDEEEDEEEMALPGKAFENIESGPEQPLYLEKEVLSTDGDLHFSSHNPGRKSPVRTAIVEGKLPETPCVFDLEADEADCPGSYQPDPPPSSIKSGEGNGPIPVDERQLPAVVGGVDETSQLGRRPRSRNGGSRRTCFQSGNSGRAEAKSDDEGEVGDGDNSDDDSSRDDDSDDKDYASDSDTANTDMEQLPPPAKRRRLGKSMGCEADATSRNAEEISVAEPATPSDQGSGESPSISTQESIEHESVEIPIRGFLSLKTFQSEVVYCLTFFPRVVTTYSQECHRRRLSKRGQDRQEGYAAERKGVWQDR